MLTGFNTDVEFNGRVFHVQTEDRGLANPVVESLVYSGGAIVTARKLPYVDLVEGRGFDEAQVQRRMESQHRDLIREILNGKHSTEPLKPFGHSLISNRSFDDVVSGFLDEQVPIQSIEVRAIESAPGRFAVREPNTQRPIVGAEVVVQLLPARGAARQLLSGRTDERGEIEVPGIPDVTGALLCQAQAAGHRSELRRPLRKAAGSART
jgi:hypothetical protein